MSVIVDTSAWIEYFKTGKNAETIDFLIDEDLILINDLILAELVPSLKLRNQRFLISVLDHVNKLELAIDWKQIVDFQYKCLKRGHNGIGIPDLVIAQNALQHRCEIYSLDQHFRLIEDILKLSLFG